MKLFELTRNSAVAALALSLSINIAFAQSSAKKKVTAPPPVPAIKEFLIQGQVFIVTKGGDNKKLALVNVYAYRPQDVSSTFSLVEERDRQLREAAQNDLRESGDRLHTTHLSRIRSEGDEYKEYAESLLAKRIPTSQAFPLMDQYAQLLKQKTALALKPLQERKEEAARKVQALQSHRYYIKSMETGASGSSKSDPDGMFEMTLPAGEYVIAALGNRSAGTSEELYEWLIKVDLTRSNKKIMLSNDNLASTRCEECVQLPTLQKPVKQDPPKTEPQTQ